MDLDTELKKPYEFEELRTIKEVKDIYDQVTTREAWLFLSLGGQHGTKLSLDDLELILEDKHTFSSSVNGRYWITVLIVWPEKTHVDILQYGELIIDADDLAFLRDKVRETLIEVEASQYGNT